VCATSLKNWVDYFLGITLFFCKSLSGETIRTGSTSVPQKIPVLRAVAHTALKTGIFWLKMIP
jgi:hypothetical protein